MTDAPQRPAIPTGWVCVGCVDDFPPDVVVSRVVGGHDVVLFRSPDGALAALDAHCAHLGAHLGGGRLDGGRLRCPFHGFCYDSSGACVAVPGSADPPARARQRTWPVRELHGLILLWLDPARGAPDWEIPDIPTADWSTWRFHRFDVAAHPLDVAENGVDARHLAAVHGYADVRVLEPIVADGPVLRGSYGFTRPKRYLGRQVEATFALEQWGLGYARVEVEVQPFGLRTRHLVLATPTTPGRIDLRIAVAVRTIEQPSRLHPLATLVPRRWLTDLAADRMRDEYVYDVSQDVSLWESRAWLDRPALAEDEAAIGRYRAWARQFLGVVA